MYKTIIVCMTCLIISGCSTFMFKAERKSQFIDINANKLLVEYGTEKHSETLPNGTEISFDHKVRITLYNGKKITLYQTLAKQGIRYKSPDKKFIFIEKGSFCQVFERELVIYQGIFNKNLTKNK